MENSTSKKGITIKQTNVLPKKDRYKTMWYNKEDYASILALSIQRRKPMVQVAHDLISSYYLCQKQEHAKTIERLKQDRAWIAAELKLYMDYFGKLPESARPEREQRDMEE